MTDLKAPHARVAGDEPAPLVGVPYVVYRAEEDAISLVEIVRLLRSEVRLIGVIVGIALLLALPPAFLRPPVYRAEALLAPVALDKREGIASLISQFGDLAALVERYVGTSQDQTAESIATLRSRALAMKFIEGRQLKPRLFAERWDARAQAWRAGARVPSDVEAYERFDREVRKVAVDRRTGLVTLTVDWRDPALAAGWANALVREVNERRRAEAVQEAAQSIQYLRDQLDKHSSVEIRQSIYRLIEAQTKAMALAQARAEYAFKVIDPAVPPERPIRPRPALIVSLGLFAGLIVGVAAALVRHAWRREAGSAPPQ